MTRIGRPLSLAAIALCSIAGRAAGQDLFANNEQAPDLTRYATPAQCVAAAARIKGVSTWGQDTDTLTHQQSTASQASMKAAAQTCGRKFLPPGVTAAAIPERQLDAAFTLAVLMDQIALSQAILERRLALKRTRPDSGDVLFDAVTVYASAHPAQLAAAQAAAVAYDRSGNTGDVVTGWWMSPYEFVLRAAIAVVDTVAIRNAAQAMLANVGALAQQDRNEGVHEAGRTGVMALTIVNLPDLLGGKVDRGVASFRRGFAALFDTLLLTQPPPFTVFKTVSHMGQKIDRLPGDFWFGLAAGDSIRPHKGRVTLVWAINQHCPFCGSDFATLRSLKRRFGARLDVVILASTSGYLRDLPPMQPAEEARAMRSMFLDYHRIDGALGVTRTPFTKRPEPDRRRVNEETPEFDRYRYPLPVLIDPDGLLAVQVPMPMAFGEPLGEPMLAWMITTMLNRTPPSH